VLFGINAAKSYLKQIEGIITSSYKVALGLPKNSSNKVSWKFSNQPTFGARVVRACDKYLFKSVLGKGRLLNKSKFIWDQLDAGRVSCRRVPFLVSRWHVVESFFKFLHKSKIHPYYIFPFKEKFPHTEFDLVSGAIAKDSNDPDKVFNQLINDSRKSSDEIEVFTDGSRSLAEDASIDSYRVGCAIFIPHINKSFSFKLNPLTSSFMEVLAIDKVCHLMDSYSWQRVNICSDSLSVFTALKNAELVFFPKAINKLNTVLADLFYKISRINFNNSSQIYLVPCSCGHIRNERVDFLAKAASINGEKWHNYISCKEISSSLTSVYNDIDFGYLFSEAEFVESYFLKNFSDTDLKLVRKFTKRSEDCKLLTRIVTGYPRTNSYLFKMNVVGSPGCCCGVDIQNINHIFWGYPLLNEERRILLVLLRSLNLFDSFSIEYLIGNLNRKIAAILLRFVGVANLRLNISI